VETSNLNKILRWSLSSFQLILLEIIFILFSYLFHGCPESCWQYLWVSFLTICYNTASSVEWPFVNPWNM
jgi:hypothetical protein